MVNPGLSRRAGERGRVGYAYVALGANLGERRAQLGQAARTLAAWPGSLPGRSSRVFESPALVLPGTAPQPDYLNAVVELVTCLPPRRLLAVLLETEARLGRQRRPEERWAPRPIDLDLLIVEEEAAGGPRRSLQLQLDLDDDGPALQLPHPRLHERGFVLAPLAELRPGWDHPVLGLSVAEMLGRVERQGVRPAGAAGSLFLPPGPSEIDNDRP